MSELDSLMNQYWRENVRANDDNPLLLCGQLTDFLAQVQALESPEGKTTDLGEWSEMDWKLALQRFGFRDDQILMALEVVASWGMVDEDVWESEADEEIEALAE